MPASLFVTEGDTFTPTELSRGPWAPQLAARRTGRRAARPSAQPCPDRGPDVPGPSDDRATPTGRDRADDRGDLGRAPGPKGAGARGRAAPRARRTPQRRDPCRPSDAATDPRRTDRAPDRPAGHRRPHQPDSPARPAPHTRDRRWTTPSSFHSKAVEHRSASGSFTEPGPARRLDPGRRSISCPTPRCRRSSGSSRPPTSATASARCCPSRTTCTSTLTSRCSSSDYPSGEWVGLDAVTHLGPRGTALAESVLFDRAGRIGRAVQTLIIDRA